MPVVADASKLRLTRRNASADAAEPFMGAPIRHMNLRKKTERSETMSSVEFVTKLHDAACMIKDACEEYLETMQQSGSKRAYAWTPEKIQWSDKTGEKGPFQISEDANNPEFRELLKDLAAHKGKLFRDHFFYWTFQNGSTVGRKKK
jgi:hypothetical protein